MSEPHSWMNYVFFGFPSTHVHTCPDSCHINQFHASIHCQFKSPSLQSIRLSTSTNPWILNRATLLIWLGKRKKSETLHGRIPSHDTSYAHMLSIVCQIYNNPEDQVFLVFNCTLFHSSQLIQPPHISAFTAHFSFPLTNLRHRSHFLQC
jgi:hypothetical protein